MALKKTTDFATGKPHLAFRRILNTLYALIFAKVRDAIPIACLPSASVMAKIQKLYPVP